MKNILKFIPIFMFLMYVVSCDVSTNVSNPSASSSLQESIAEQLAKSENLTNSKFSVSGASFSLETINDVEFRVLEIAFSNGEVDLTDENLARISLYQLSDAATATELYTRATTSMSFLSYLYTPSSSGTKGGNLKLYYPDGVISQRVELVISNSLTADNGTKKINQNGDAYVGEDGEEESADSYFEELAGFATTANPTVTPITTGVSRNSPQSTFTVANSYDPLTGIVTLTVGGVGVNLDAFTNESLLGNFVFQTFDYATMSWSNATRNSENYVSSTGILTIQMNMLVDGTPYRYSYSTYEMYQSAATEGFQRRGSHDKFEGLIKISGIVNNSGTYFSSGTVTPVLNNENGYNSVDITFAGMTGEILPSTLTSTSVRIFLTPDGGEKTRETFTSTIAEISDNKFRFILDNQVIDKDSTVNVEILPTVQTDNNTPSVTTDDLYFGNPAAANGIGMITG